LGGIGIYRGQYPVAADEVFHRFHFSSAQKRKTDRLP
jgi:hypothetical protein